MMLSNAGQRDQHRARNCHPPSDRTRVVPSGGRAAVPALPASMAMPRMAAVVPVRYVPPARYAWASRIFCSGILVQTAASILTRCAGTTSGRQAIGPSVRTVFAAARVRAPSPKLRRVSSTLPTLMAT
jgi:hypothetical protein